MIFVVTATEALGAIIVVTAIATVASIEIRQALRQRRCKHVAYFENGQCHAICRECRKDLGFIGTLRDQRAQQDAQP